MSRHLVLVGASGALLLLVGAGCLAAPAADPEPQPVSQAVRAVELVGGLRHPWSLAFLPDGRMLVTERPGGLVAIEGSDARQISGLPEIVARGQGGLMEVAVHPSYRENGWIYLTYSEGGRQGTATTLARARLEGDRLVELNTLFQQDRHSTPGRHYGSRLAFTPDGRLLMSIGDRGSDPPRAQDLGDHAGTLLRLEADGRPAAGNPFVGRPGARPEIYSYGHRNIQGLVVDGQSGVIWATEHGPRGGDELNRIEAGGNYGWPEVSQGRDYGTRRPIGVPSRRGMVDPLVVWTPSIAPSGLALVHGGRYPGWEGNLLAGALAGQQLRRIVLEGDGVAHQEALLEREIGRIRDVRLGPDGFVYLLTDARDGALFRLEVVE